MILHLPTHQVLVGIEDGKKMFLLCISEQYCKRLLFSDSTTK